MISALKWLRHMMMVVGILLLPAVASAQEEEKLEEGDSIYVDVGTRLLMFMEELDELRTVSDMPLTVSGNMPVPQSLVSVYTERVTLMSQTFNAIDVKWSTFLQANQQEVAADEDLMEVVASFQEMKQGLADTLTVKRQTVDALKTFVAADNDIISQIPTYKRLSRLAFQLSLVKKLAPQLEKLKAREALLFPEIQTHYEEAKAAVVLVPSLAPRMKILEDQYVSLESTSELIQTMEYKPFFARIKDYLLGIAAVSVVLMFISMATTRIKAWKQIRDNMKKYKDMMNNGKGGADYPTI